MSLEIISLTSNHKKKPRQRQKNLVNMVIDRQGSKNPQSRFFPHLQPHIKEYLQTHKRKVVDLDDLTKYLKQKHGRIYGRVKENLLKKNVEAAYDVVEFEIKTQHKEESELEDDSPEFSSDDENYVETVDTNLVNNSLQKLYHKTPQQKSQNKQKDDCSPSREKKRKTMKRKIEDDDDNEKEMPAKIKNTDGFLKESNVKFADMAGCEEILVTLGERLIGTQYPEVLETLNLKPTRGILLKGPPGCGKSMLAKGIAGQLNYPYMLVGATELVAGISGESEEKIRELFKRATANAPCVIIIDEIDAIAIKRAADNRGMENRIVTQLLTSMDELNAETASVQVLVIATTNRPDALDPALRRTGRFDFEVSVSIPDEAARRRILELYCKDLPLDLNINLAVLARRIPGYVGADIQGLVAETVQNAFTRTIRNFQQNKIDDEVQVIDTVDNDKITELRLRLQKIITRLENPQQFTDEQLKDVRIENSDFETVLKNFIPSAKRHGFATVPDVTWDDVGALKEIREVLYFGITASIQHRELYETMDIPMAAGFLLYGPPGCGKTLIAKAIANESGLNFISVKGPELINMYVGESERGIRQCFERARNSAPCVIFFDEFDALCQERSDSTERTGGTRLVNQLLTEMDGLDARGTVFVIAATNRPNSIDPAILRPGRLDTQLYVGLPTPADRVDILKTITRKGPPVESDVNFEEIGLSSRCDKFSSADLSRWWIEARLCAVKELIQTTTGAKPCIAKRHIETAFEKVKPSVLTKDLAKYTLRRDK